MSNNRSNGALVGVFQYPKTKLIGSTVETFLFLKCHISSNEYRCHLGASIADEPDYNMSKARLIDEILIGQSIPKANTGYHLGFRYQ